MSSAAREASDFADLHRRYPVSAQLSPIVSEFESEEQAASYDAWFRAKVQASLDDERPSISHDEVMAEMKMRLAAKREKRRNDR
nr:antitoxin [Pseudomonas sp. SLFW]